MSTFIKGKCFTNLDNYDCSEIQIFARVPNIGERVMCKYKGNSSSLRVCQIYHDIRGERGNEHPFVIVELNQ